jgi:hypothetical protein
MTPAEIENIYRAADNHVAGLFAVFEAGKSWARVAFSAAETYAIGQDAVTPQPQVDTSKLQVQTPDVSTQVFGAKKTPS